MKTTNHTTHPDDIEEIVELIRWYHQQQITNHQQIVDHVTQDLIAIIEFEKNQTCNTFERNIWHNTVHTIATTLKVTK